MKNIKLIFYDFDGVMTDNRVLVREDGKEAVFVNRSDGLAVQKIKQMGIRQVIVSTEKNSVVGIRAQKLGLSVIQAIDDKRAVVEKYLADNKIDPKETIFVGNDINDKEAMLLVGWPIAPANAHPDIKKIARRTLNARGGYGAVREMLDVLQEERS